MSHVIVPTLCTLCLGLFVVFVVSLFRFLFFGLFVRLFVSRCVFVSPCVRLSVVFVRALVVLVISLSVLPFESFRFRWFPRVSLVVLSFVSSFGVSCRVFVLFVCSPLVRGYLYKCWSRPHP